VSRKTKKNYVEAHHFVPFSYQARFSHSLDVEENVVVLCPNCHRKLHHGTAAEKAGPLEQLFTERKTALDARGILVSLTDVRAMYRSLSFDD
jgi:5-methylcytosine-specific restriction protein A